MGNVVQRVTAAPLCWEDPGLLCSATDIIAMKGIPLAGAGTNFIGSVKNMVWR